MSIFIDEVIVAVMIVTVKLVVTAATIVTHTTVVFMLWMLILKHILDQVLQDLMLVLSFQNCLTRASCCMAAYTLS